VRRSNLRLLDEAFVNLSPKMAATLRVAASRGRSILHFSDINKLGLNPRTEYETPAGIYGYLLDKDSMRCVLGRTDDEAGYGGVTDKGVEYTKPFDVLYRECGISSFATDRKFVHVGELRGHSREGLFIVRVRRNGSSNFTETDLKALTAKLSSWVIDRHRRYIKLISPEFIKKIPILRNRRAVDAVAEYESDWGLRYGLRRKMAAVAASSKFQSPFGRLWNITRVMARNAIAWGVLLEALGIVAVFDEGASLIHGGEPRQAVIFRGDMIKHIYAGLNPINARRRHRGMDDERKKEARAKRGKFIKGAVSNWYKHLDADYDYFAGLSPTRDRRGKVSGLDITGELGGNRLYVSYSEPRQTITVTHTRGPNVLDRDDSWYPLTTKNVRRTLDKVLRDVKLMLKREAPL
jgi:hypothetical protein